MVRNENRSCVRRNKYSHNADHSRELIEHNNLSHRSYKLLSHGYELIKVCEVTTTTSK